MLRNKNTNDQQTNDTQKNSKNIEVLHKLVSNSTKKGYLLKQGGAIRQWRKRWFCLKRNELFYFESAHESKLTGKFVITEDFRVTAVEDKQIKKEFCIKFEGKSLKQTRFLAAENERQREEWIEALSVVPKEVSEKKYDRTYEAILCKLGPKGNVWKRRYCILIQKELYYYKQQGDLIPCGIIFLSECSKLEIIPYERFNRNFCFSLLHKNRTYYFHVDNNFDSSNVVNSSNSKYEFEKWIELLCEALSVKLNRFQEISRRSLKIGSPIREVFLSKPLKEGILYKLGNQIKKSKPIRLVLTYHFIYYFPNPSSAIKYHAMHLLDCSFEAIPSSIEKVKYSFRLNNLLHPLYLGAEDENELLTWKNIFQKVKSASEELKESVTDQEIKKNAHIDYTVEVLNEKIDKGRADSKYYEIQVKAFWTSWIVQKSYEAIFDFYAELGKRFPSYVFPEMLETPAYAEGLEQQQIRRKSLRGKSLLGFLTINSGRLAKSNDSQYDLKFIQCLMREILRNSEISQCELVLGFFDLDNFFSAVRRGEIAGVRYFLDRNKPVDVLDDNDLMSPLIIAAQLNHKQIVDALITAGANPNFANCRKQTPLYFALMNGNLDVAKYLVERGANIQISDDSGISLMHLSAMKALHEFINLLLEKGVSINTQDKGFRTPLHYAVIEGQLETIKLVIDKGANLEIQDEEGFTALMTACWKMREDIVRYLIDRNARVDVLDKNKRSCAHLAVLRKSETILAFLADAKLSLDLISGSGMAPIHLATSKGYENIVQYLLSRGADITVREENTQQTSLHLAVMGSNKTRLVEILLEVSGQQIINFQDIEGKTPLHLAMECDNIAAVKLLVKNGANIELVDLNGQVPLHIAIEKENLEAVMLLSNQTTINVVTKSGNYPIHLAVIKGSEDIVDFLIKFHSDLNVKDREGNTALHLALMNKQYKIALLLSEAGASLSVLNDSGNPPIFYAPTNKLKEIQEASSRFQGAI